MTATVDVYAQFQQERRQEEELRTARRTAAENATRQLETSSLQWFQQHFDQVAQSLMANASSAPTVVFYVGEWGSQTDLPHFSWVDGRLLTLAQWRRAAVPAAAHGRMNWLHKRLIEEQLLLNTVERFNRTLPLDSEMVLIYSTVTWSQVNVTVGRRPTPPKSVVHGDTKHWLSVCSIL